MSEASIAFVGGWGVRVTKAKANYDTLKAGRNDTADGDWQQSFNLIPSVENDGKKFRCMWVTKLTRRIQ